MNNRLTNKTLDGVNSGVGADEMDGKYYDPDLFPADKILDKMAPNLAEAEARTKERPLRTENTPIDR